MTYPRRKRIELLRFGRAELGASVFPVEDERDLASRGCAFFT